MGEIIVNIGFLFLVAAFAGLAYMMWQYYNRVMPQQHAEQIETVDAATFVAAEGAEKIAEAVLVANETSQMQAASELLDTKKFVGISYKNKILLPKLFQEIKLRFAQVELIRDYVEDYNGRKIILKIVHEGITHGLLINGPDGNNTIGQDQISYVGEEGLTPWINEEGMIEYANSVNILVPIEDCDEECRADIGLKLRELLKECKFDIARRTKLGSGQTEVTTFVLTESESGLHFSDTTIVTEHMSPALLGVSYPPPILQIGNSKFNPPMHEALPFITTLLGDGKNLVILGKTRTGKTSLTKEIIFQMVAQFQSTAIVQLDYAAISQLETARGKSAMLKLVDRAKIMNLNLLFVIDEGQTIAHGDHPKLAFLLELMNGLANPAITQSVLVSLNAEAKDLDQALLGPGRAHVIMELDALPAQQALKVVKQIQTDNEDLTFSASKFEEQLNAQTPYSNVGHIALGEIWECFTKTDDVTKWTKQLATYKMPAKKIPTPE